MSRLRDQLPAGSLLWMWHHPQRGGLVTAVLPDGEVRELRSHPRDDSVSQGTVGRIDPERVTGLLAAARLVLQTPVVPATDPLPEGFSVALKGTEGALTERWVAATELSGDPGLRTLREQVLAVRAAAEGGRFRWRSLAGRLFWLLIAVSLGILWLILRDGQTGNELERHGERLSGQVIRREGKSGYDRDKFIEVRFSPQGGGEVVTKIEQYLSAENWAAAVPGTSVALLHLPLRQQTYLESDIRRWQHDKHWIVLFPAALSLLGFAVLVCFPRYRVGVHSDGQEYLIVGDKVVSDDKDFPVSRLALNVSRLLWNR